MLYRNRYVVPSIRLKHWDYRSPGYYFVTICAKQRWTQPFGHIQHGFMCLTDMGTIVARAWLQTPIIRPYIGLDTWVIMPDHFHGIVRIIDYRPVSDISSVVSMHPSVDPMNRSVVETHGHASLQIDQRIPQIDQRIPQIDQRIPQIDQRIRQYNQFGPQSNNLAAIIRGFKGTTTKQIHMMGHNHFQWQSRYYEKIIRSHRELLHVRQYILNNPKKWYNDQ